MKRIDNVREYLPSEVLENAVVDGAEITDYKLAEKTLKRLMKQQEVMSAISQSFSTTRDMDDLIFEALKMAGEFMGVNHAFVSAYRKDEGYLQCLYEWYDAKGKPFIGGEDKWPISTDMDIYRDLTEKGYAAINDYKLLMHPKFQTVRNYDLRAFLNIPIVISGEFWGIIGFIINKSPYDWSKSDIHMGKLIAGLFSGAVSRSIVEKNLFVAIKDAERASKSKGDFLSNMSHEIRTPMNAIIGMTQIASTSDDPQKIRYCLERIDGASKHLLGLINDILDMSKIEANKINLSAAEFDLEKMLINITGVVNFKVEEKKQNFIINIDNEVPSVLIGDELRLSQVIANLLTNAVKFTPEGGTITVNVRNQELSGDAATLLIEVIDTGIGISEEQQTRLFNPFEQADTSTTRKYGGTGLGLPICKGIVALMGGRIWIESEMGKGSKFSFTAQVKVGSAKSKSKSAGMEGGDEIRVLAVDNSREMRDYFLHVMPELGLPCDVAESGASALKMMEQNQGKQYNVFFIDWTVSDVNGIELTKEIKRITRDNAVIIMISMEDWSAIEQEAIEAGVDGFISKPLFPSVLVDAINKLRGAEAAVKMARQDTQVKNFSEYTILVAEDIEINREIISAVLSETQISIEFATDGVEAVSMFVENPDKYSLILMDVQMPEMDGYDATRGIRAIEREKQRKGSIPIIAMTANVFMEDIERCLQSGMDDHVGKPLDTEELISKLDMYFLANKERNGEI